MQVWLPVEPPSAKVGGPEARAALSISFLSGNAQIEGVNDGSEPKSSGEGVTRLTHWWPHKGTVEWVGYAWKKPISVSGAKVYWFDDTGRGECRLPESWHMERLDGDKWIPIPVASYPIHKDQWCEVKFDPIQTSALRLVVHLQSGWAAGVRQWKVVENED
jgi:hypothetical protein